MFFILFWRRQLAACQCLKCASYRDSLGERSCPRSTTAIHSVAVDRTLNPPIERRTSYRRLERNVRHQCLGVMSGDVMMCSWDVTEKPKI